MKCRECDASLSDSAKFCEFCGAATERETVGQGWVSDPSDPMDPELDDLTRTVARGPSSSSHSGIGEISSLHGVIGICALGLIGCFLPMVSGPALVGQEAQETPTIMTSGAQLSPIFYAVPGCLLLIGVLAFLVLRDAVAPREAWLGVGLAVSGFLLGASSLMWALLRQVLDSVPGATTGIGIILPWLVAAVSTLVLSRTLFATR